VSELLAVPLIEAAKERYPDVRIRVVEAMSGYILEWLRRGEVDLAMIYSTSDPRGLGVHHGLSEEICLFASSKMEGRGAPPGEAIRLKDAVALPLVVPGPRHGLRELIQDTATAVRVPIHPAIEIDSYSQIKKLVARGLGYGILPRMAIEREVRAGAFRVWRFERPRITRKVLLAYSTERPLLNAPRAIGRLAWDTLRELVRDGAWTATLAPEPQQSLLGG
jgi:LysR family nitrogen assimilation transcriptional regulator